MLKHKSILYCLHEKLLHTQNVLTDSEPAVTTINTAHASPNNLNLTCSVQ